MKSSNICAARRLSSITPESNLNKQEQIRNITFKISISTHIIISLKMFDLSKKFPINYRNTP